MKRFSFALLAAIFILGSFSACKQTVKNNNDEIAITAGTETITVGEIKYFIESIKSQVSQNQTEEQIKEFWETEIDGKMPEVVIKDNAVEYCVELITMVEIAKNNGITVSDQEVNAEISKEIPQDQLKKMADSLNLTVDIIKSVQKKQIIAQRYQESLAGDPRMQPSDEDLKKFFSEKYLKAQHILKMTISEADQTPLPQEEKDKKKAEIEEILVKVKEPRQDFKELMMEVSEDPGSKEQPDGYVFTEGNMVEEFYQAALNLKPNEISDIVESSFGYHIIKRLPLDLETDYNDMLESVTQGYQSSILKEITDELKQAMNITKNEEVINTITVK